MPTSQSDDQVAFQGLLADMFEQQLKDSPELATDLGLDRGRHAGAAARWDDRSLAADAAFLDSQRDFRRRLARVDAARLSGDERVHRDTLLGHLGNSLDAAEKHSYGVRGDAAPFMGSQFSATHPYVLSPLDGAYGALPDFLTMKHRLESADDADAFVERVARIADAMDQESARAAIDLQRGVVPPRALLESTLKSLGDMLQQEAAALPAIQRLRAAAAELQMDPGLAATAAKTFEKLVRPALRRQMALLESHRSRAPQEPGVWQLPGGEDYYRHACSINTSSSLPAKEIHQLGLQEVAAISARLDALLKTHGYSAGAVGERLAGLASEARFTFADTEAGKQSVLALLRELTDQASARMASMFGKLPTSELDIRRVPAALEGSAPRGYAQTGSLDGSRSGAFYANLRTTAEWTRFFLPTFAFHEGIPGHHLQKSLALESATVPPVNKVLWLPGFGEGWACYAEQLADELGLYAHNPMGQIGYLQSMLFRAARLVVDTGLHHHRWPRQRCIDYLRATLGERESRCASEVDRYAVWPGQALSYKCGHIAWVSLRDRMQRELGARFSLKNFHDAALRHGCVPFAVLETAVSARLKTDPA